MALRNYQQRSIIEVRHACRNGVMPSLPTGAGKTVVACYVRRPAARCSYCGTPEGEQHRGGCPEVVR